MLKKPEPLRYSQQVTHFHESEVTQSCPALSDPMDCSLPGSSIHGIFQTRLLEWVAIAFAGRDLWSFPLYCFPLFLCTDHWGRLSYCSLLLFGTLHSDGYIFPFLCFLLLFFSQLFVRPPQTTIFPCCISSSWGWFCSLPPVQCYKSLSIVLQALCLPDLQNIRAGSHYFLHGVFQTQRSNPHLLHWQVDSLPLSYLGSPW